jgi:predicted MPP superfamily phosphohydrolase
MSVTIVHLSDSHFSDGNQNPLLSRSAPLCGAIRSMVEPSDNCAIIFTGDVANHGRSVDYDLASTFIQNVRKEIYEHIRREPIFVLVPGNHDHDFSTPEFDERVRNIIIDDSSPSKPPSKAMDDQLFKFQKPFRDFIKGISSQMQVYASSGLLDSFKIEFDSINVRFYLLNTTRFTKKQEVPGSSWFPIKDLSDKFDCDKDGGNLNIGILHHPYTWHRPNNARELRRLLESRCDIVFTGHEHNPDMFKQTRRPTEQSLYVEGGILQDNDNSGNSSFNIIKLMSENQTFLCTTFCWNGSIYEQITDSYEHKYLRLRQALRNEFDISDEWHVWLEEVGTDFRHPREHALKMSDIFVYPDLQKLDIRKACSPMGNVHDRDVLGYIQEKREYL